MLWLTFYARPDGNPSDVPLINVTEEDEAYFLENNVRISAEDDPISGGFIVYGDDGTMMEDGTPDEVVVISRGRNCEDTMAELARLLKLRRTES